ncbi:TetR/AcrR family transcriptional regulator [Anaeromyxobacter sp. Fw109-5]|uniref:TetR/AcrR family transcriptional regulator n=1 Tax=Anaeromyxobacter sp. (strain Fw109-5) TaxID=404589 RepID=UPI000158A47F|nr:TetR/AcrR family transcriptional regulator [Anaeromyxobacter sp. Fw109-5]ABS26708.1 transcriptional regulator, TetR family [Anaeromyxobacter sp. Fw109-5]
MSRARTPPARNVEGTEPEKRRAILHAAVRVFAEKGYHGCRIADVARSADVAYGLVYHYFRNKEELLESVFAEQWTILINAIRAIDEGPGTASDKVAAIFGFVFDVYKTAPAAVRVLILEVTRTPQGLRAGSTRETFDRAVHLVADVVRQGQQRGEFRSDLDPLIAAAGLLGALELAMTGMVIGIVPAGDESAVDRTRREIVELVCGGLRRR